MSTREPDEPDAVFPDVNSLGVGRRSDDGVVPDNFEEVNDLSISTLQLDLCKKPHIQMRTHVRHLLPRQ